MTFKDWWKSVDYGIKLSTSPGVIAEAAWKAGVESEQERCALAVKQVAADLNGTATEAETQGDALRKLVERDGALLALAAIRKGE